MGTDVEDPGKEGDRCAEGREFIQGYVPGGPTLWVCNFGADLVISWTLGGFQHRVACQLMEKEQLQITDEGWKSPPP